MPAERYFLDHLFKEGETYPLTGSEFHHLAHVMRTRKGDAIELVNGRGSLAQTIVQELMKESALLKIQILYQESKHPCRLILAQAIPKANRLDFILEKGTELGVDHFELFPGQHSAKKECHLGRARNLIIAAMKQCGRLYLPSLAFSPPIDEWENLTNRRAFFGDLNPEAPPFEIVWKSSPFPLYPTIFITGPEGGLSGDEIQSLRKIGALGVKLHHHTLRTETASLMALSLLSHWEMTED